MLEWYFRGKPTRWLRLRNLLESIFRWVPKVNVDEPNILGEKDGYWIYNELRSLGCTYIFLSDEKYQVTDKASIAQFLALDDTDKEKYTPVWFDCDNFSFRLMGQFHRGKWACLAFGIGWSETHAFNVFFDDKECYIVEPQTDNIIKASEAPSQYKLYFAVI